MDLSSSKMVSSIVSNFTLRGRMLRIGILITTSILVIRMLENANAQATNSNYFGIRIVDQDGRGIPLVILRTVDNSVSVTDNEGWVAFHEPGSMGTEVYWNVEGPGVEFEKDGFGFQGFKAVADPGKTITIKARYRNIAKRVGRTTGRGRFRDSELLEIASSEQKAANRSIVVGQDSVQAVVMKDTIFWLWGDTNVSGYPLGNYSTTSAFTPKSIKPVSTLEYEYLLRSDSSSLRKMFPTSEPGVVWMFGLVGVQGKSGENLLIAGYSRRRGLSDPLENGIALYDPQRGHFLSIAKSGIENDFSVPHGNATIVDSEGDSYVYFCRPFPQTRVRNTSESIQSPDQYEHAVWNSERIQWEWTKGGVPTSQEEERKLIKEQRMPIEQNRYQVLDRDSSLPLRLHSGSVRWNEFRKRYVMIAVELGDGKSPSQLGEIWYSESESIDGPWRDAIKVATHPNYSFYNPVHHTFWDENNGEIIYFEGTYTNQFSGNKWAVPRYEYNQLLYQLDLRSILTR